MKDWLACAHLNVGVPRWLTAATIALGIIFSVWLCLVIPSAAPKQKIKSLVIKTHKVSNLLIHKIIVLLHLTKNRVYRILAKFSKKHFDWGDFIKQSFNKSIKNTLNMKIMEIIKKTAGKRFTLYRTKKSTNIKGMRALKVHY